MSMTITIAGNSTDDVMTADTITVGILGCLPDIIDDGSGRRMTSGRWQRRVRCRRVYHVTFNEFSTVPDTDYQDSRTIHELYALLRSKYLWITAFGDEVVRMMEPAIGLVDHGTVVLPLAVQIGEWPSLSADYDRAADNLAGLSLYELDEL